MRLVLRGALLGLLVTQLAGASPARAGTVARDDTAQWLAFYSDGINNPSVLSSLARNGDYRRLASSRRDAYPCDLGDVVSVGYPRWSPDGSMLSFLQVVVTTDVGCDDHQETEDRLTVMQPDGSEQRTLVASQHIQQAGWAADGSSLYYTTGNLDGLWSVGVDGSTPEQINSMDGWQEVSPSGDRVAVIPFDHPLDQTMSVAAIDGSDPTEIAAVGPYASGRDLRWSPDGGWIATIRRGRVLLVRPDGSERRVVWRGEVYGLDFSASGGKLVVAAYDDDLWVVDLATGRSHNVTQTDRRREYDPTWRPRP